MIIFSHNLSILLFNQSINFIASERERLEQKIKEKQALKKDQQKSGTKDNHQDEKKNQKNKKVNVLQTLFGKP